MPPEITYPGVYVIEVPAGAHPIPGVSTSTTAFVGSARRGPFHKPTKTPCFREYEEIFGGLAASSEMSYAVKQFFDNGGTEAWVMRIKPGSAASGGLQIRRNDFAAFDEVKDINLLCLPGVRHRASLAAADAYSKSRRAFLVLDAPKSAVSPADMATAASALPKSESAAVYYPWINLPDPLAKGKLRLSAPSGSVAGMYARMDSTRGIWKAPAGEEASLQSAQSLAQTVGDRDAGTLNALGVNTLRVIPGAGVVAWGARTLAGSNQSGSDWKYINLRRLFLFLEHSIDEGTQCAVFEPNDEPLWAKVSIAVGAFLRSMFLQGAFQGATPKDAFFVKCGRDTMTQDDIDNGRLIILIGFAPLKPAEFVIFRIQQKTLDTSTS